MVPLSGSHTLSCPVRGSLSSWGLLPWCRPVPPGGWMVQARRSLLPSPVSLFCSVLSDCVAQVSYVDSRALPEFFLGSLIIIIDLFAGTDAGVSHLAILLTLLCRSQTHISFLFFKFPCIFQLRLTFNVSGV